MARITKARGKIVRRLGINVFGNPKYDRLLKRKPYKPGVARKAKVRRGRVSEYGRQLIEKQKLRFAYGLSERQFSNLFYKARAMPGITGYNMLALLERRLDNVVYRLGMGVSRQQSRQLVSHGHIHYNGRKVSIPSIRVRPGDVITIAERKQTVDFIRSLLSENASRPIPDWLRMSRDDLRAEVLTIPVREQIPFVAEEQLVVEYYSK